MAKDTTLLEAEKVAAEIKKLSAEAKAATFEAEKTELQIAQLKREKAYTDSLFGYAREFPFFGAVTDTSVRECIDVLGRWSRRDPGDPITVTFNSPGGSVIHGLALYDFIEELKAKGHYVTTVTRGYAASMGGILLQVGQKRIVGKNAHLMIHEVSSLGIGKLSEMEDEVKFCKRLMDERLVPILADRSNLTPRQIKTRMNRKDWWLNASECVKFGFADEIG